MIDTVYHTLYKLHRKNKQFEIVVYLTNYFYLYFLFIF